MAELATFYFGVAMASGVNVVHLLGTLGAAPEMKYTQSGQAVCTFSIATNEAWQDKAGQKQERATWHRIVVWAKLAELCGQYLDKGRQVFVEGKIQTRKYESNGVERTAFEILARNVTFLGGKNEAYAENRTSGDHKGQHRQGAADDLGYGAAEKKYGRDAGEEPDDLPF